MKKIALILLLLLFSPNLFSKKVFVCSFHPVSAIVKELTGTAADVKTIAGSGISPHTYSMKPSDMIKIELADGFIYLGGNVDVWAEKLEKADKINLLSMLPEDDLLTFDHDHSHENDTSHSDIDPHFWLDPLTVIKIIPALKDKLIELDNENANVYNANANAFEKKLAHLNNEIERMLNSKRGKPVFQFHPSFNYFIKRYKLVNAGVIEKNPGNEPTARETAELINKISRSGTGAIFSEPQLSDKSIKMIAKEANVSLYELDPVGGIKGRERYSDLILYNAKIFQKAL